MFSIIRKHADTAYRILWCAAFLMMLFFTKLETARIAPVAVVLVLVLCAGLIVLRRARLLALPFFLLCFSLIFCYDSFAVFIRYLWLLPVVLIALTVHIIRLSPKFLRGESFFPLCAVALATVLSGAGALTFGEFFSPVALYYTVGLGPGLVFVYWIFKNEMREEASAGQLAADLAAFALCATVFVVFYRLTHIPAAGVFGTIADVQWSNNLATMLLYSTPMVYALAKKHFAWLFAGFATSLGTVLTGSRGGILFAPVLAVCCLVWLWLTEDPSRVPRRLWFRFFACFGTVCALSAFLLVAGNVILPHLSVHDNAREQLVLRSFSDFRENPLFGKGFAYQGNGDLYQSKQGGMNWFHMFFPQIIGAMGLCGILAWGWQLFVRARLAFLHRGEPVFAFALCYLGLFLMSQVNPGEFCPVPYALCTVLFMVALETAGAKPAVPEYSEKGRKRKEKKEAAEAAGK